MKRIIACFLTLMLCAPFAMPCGARAASAYDTMIVTSANGAVMYDSCYLETRKPLALVPYGGVVLYIDVIDWGYCVAFGNYLGYIEFGYLAQNVNNWRVFALPTGQDYSIAPYDPPSDWRDYLDDWFYNDNDIDVPAFSFTPLKCVANRILVTRSGPNTKYNSPGAFNVNGEITVYYQAPGNGVQWGCFEFWHNSAKYRVYTGMKRVDTYSYVPNCAESYADAIIVEGHTPHYGPGYEYAVAENYVPRGSSVQALYQENGWLLFEYTLSDGVIQRAWAPSGYWY